MSAPTDGLWPPTLRNYAKRGLAIGRANILTDDVEFYYRREEWAFSTRAIVHECTSDGTFYTIPVKKLRKIAKRYANG